MCEALVLYAEAVDQGRDDGSEGAAGISRTPRAGMVGVGNELAGSMGQII